MALKLLSLAAGLGPRQTSSPARVAASGLCRVILDGGGRGVASAFCFFLLGRSAAALTGVSASARALGPALRFLGVEPSAEAGMASSGASSSPSGGCGASELAHARLALSHSTHPSLEVPCGPRRPVSCAC